MEKIASTKNCKKFITGIKQNFCPRIIIQQLNTNNIFLRKNTNNFGLPDCLTSLGLANTENSSCGEGWHAANQFGLLN